MSVLFLFYIYILQLSFGCHLQIERKIANFHIFDNFGIYAHRVVTLSL